MSLTEAHVGFCFETREVSEGSSRDMPSVAPTMAQAQGDGGTGQSLKEMGEAPVVTQEEADVGVGQSQVAVEVRSGGIPDDWWR